MKPIEEKKRRRVKSHLFDRVLLLPGVHKIEITELQQNLIGCVPGEDITTEDPWILIDKQTFLDNLLKEETSDLPQYIDDIHSYPRDKLLIGYKSSINGKKHNFLVCVSETSVDKIMELLQKIRSDQESKLESSVQKKVGQWLDLGSSVVVDECILKKFRPLLDVLIESKYPIVFPQKCRFTLRRVESVRDGYMEMKSSPDLFKDFIKHRRIDAFVQVTNTTRDKETQVPCKYPNNFGTQYSFTYQKVEDNSKQINKIMQDNTNDIEDMLLVNSNINFYEDDYNLLTSNLEILYRKFKKESLANFFHLDYCKNKMVGGVSFHPIYQDIVALSYVNHSKNVFRKHHIDKTSDDVVPVLIWSIADSLVPKLLLECHREVRYLAFCPFNSNLLVGGCANGQLILWDLQHKLSRKQKTKWYTDFQYKCKNHMKSLMVWMKDVYKTNIVRVTAVSDYRFSHKGPIVNISWSSKFYEVSKTGKFLQIPSDENRTALQFFTASEDGTILIWDLLQMPFIESGGFKPIRILRRLDKRPSALLESTSPFRIFHLNLKPCYNIKVVNTAKKLLSLSSAKLNFEVVKCVNIRVFGKGNRDNVNNILEFIKPTSRIEPVLQVGSHFGQFLKVKWSGHDFDSGELIHSENAQYENYTDYHNGPVISVSYNVKLKLTLTVGGSILCIWSDDYKTGPLLWRKSKFQYTNVSWHQKHYYNFSASRTDGCIETWLLYAQSKSFAKLVNLTSYCLTEYLAPLDAGLDVTDRTIIGHGDSHGFFGCLNIPRTIRKSLHPELAAATKKFIQREITRKKLFLDWQQKWNTFHRKVTTSEEIEANIPTNSKEPLLNEYKMDKRIELNKKLTWNQDMKYFDYLKLNNKYQQEQKIRKIIIEKHQLNLKEIEKRRKPLKTLAIDQQLKLQRKKEKLRHVDKNFEETKKMLYPEMYNGKRVKVEIQNEEKVQAEKKRKIYDMYEQICIDVPKYIERHKFEYKFNWKETLRSKHGVY